MWYQQKTKPQDIKLMREFLKTNFNIKFRIVRFGGSSALCQERLIELDHREVRTLQEFYSMTFHEIAHIHCFDHGLYYIFHHDALPAKSMAQYMKKMGVRVEKFVDKKGKELMQVYLPGVPFIGAYDDPKNVQWLRRWIKRNYG